MGLIFLFVLLIAVLLGCVLSLFPKRIKLIIGIILAFMIVTSWGSMENAGRTEAYGYALFTLPLLIGSFIGLLFIELVRFLIKKSKE